MIPARPHPGNLANKRDSRTRDPGAALLPRPRSAAASIEPLGGTGVFFIGRRADQCAWPLEPWDGVATAEKRCCGQSVEPDKRQPYCKGHRDLGTAGGTAGGHPAPPVRRAGANAPQRSRGWPA